MSLEEFLEKEQDSLARKNELLREFFGCLSRAFQYLHETKIRHRDIKPANILIYQDKVKVADFGLSLDWTGKHSTTTAGTSPGWSPRYRAPEMVEEKPRNSSSDIWSLGCVFLEMVTVLKGETVKDLFEFIKTYGTKQSGDSAAYYHENPEAIIAWTKKLMAKSQIDNEPIAWANEMLQPESKDRPHAAKLVDKTCDQGKPIRWPYCGICCADGSDDEGDAGSETDPFLYDVSLSIKVRVLIKSKGNSRVYQELRVVSLLSELR
jgi:serine/threonine protein kinase